MALKDWVPQVSKALDQALTDHIALTQGKLSQANPKDTGRMASSWFVGKDQPDLQVRDKDWGKPAKRKYPGGVGTATLDGNLTAGTTYYVIAVTATTIKVATAVGGTNITMAGTGGTGGTGSAVIIKFPIKSFIAATLG